jgi:hypothetical protein
MIKKQKNNSLTQDQQHVEQPQKINYDVDKNFEREIIIVER